MVAQFAYNRIAKSFIKTECLKAQCTGVGMGATAPTRFGFGDLHQSLAKALASVWFVNHQEVNA